jgi:hypothetical protein
MSDLPCHSVRSDVDVVDLDFPSAARSVNATGPEVMFAGASDAAFKACCQIIHAATHQ